MKVRLTIQVDSAARYVIAKYFGGKRTRATRDQVRRFAASALAGAVAERRSMLGGRSRTVVSRLSDTAPAPDAEAGGLQSQQIKLF